jgi:hypothetical protein
MFYKKWHTQESSTDSFCYLYLVYPGDVPSTFLQQTFFHTLDDRDHHTVSFRFSDI